MYRDKERKQQPMTKEDYLKLNLYRANIAKARFEAEGIRYIRPSEDSDRFIVFGQGRDKFQFYAGIGLILGPYEDRGLDNMVNIAKYGRQEEK